MAASRSGINGLTQAGSAVIFGSGSPWRLRMVTDFNGDVKPDLLWQQPVTGHLYAWFLNGTTLLGDGWVTPTVVGPGWNVVGGK
jgi:hypothetical protein